MYRRDKKIVEFCNKFSNQISIDISEQRRYLETPGQKNKLENIIVKNWGTTKGGLPKWPGNHWTNEPTEPRLNKIKSKDLCLKCQIFHVEYYKILSSLIHSGSTALFKFTPEIIKGFFILFHSYIQDFFLIATKYFIEEFSLKNVDNSLDSDMPNLDLLRIFHLTKEMDDGKIFEPI